MKTKVIASHVTGNANVKAALHGLMEAEILAEFHVTIASVPESIFGRIGAIDLFSEIKRRSFDQTLKPFLCTWPWFELGRIIALKTGLTKLTGTKSSPFHIDAVMRNLDRHVANRIKKKGQNIEINAVYSYEDMALFTFREAKQLGLQCLYDLPIGYWKTAQKLLDNEKQRWPEWVSTMPGFTDSLEKLAHKDEELRLADKIFVASTFTANTLNDFPSKLAPIEIIPYGFPPVSDEKRNYANFKTKRPLKLLYVGSLSQRKGIADLFKAAQHFGQKVELTIVGRKTTDNCIALNNALTKYHWIDTLPHEKILKLMRENDVLVFPSLFEGFGLVISEAMSQGTPVITTNRTAGPDIITNKENGWLIEAGSTTALINAIEEILINPKVIQGVGQAAMEKAKERPWELYGTELANAINKTN